jgi:hypothetical protein
MYRVIPFLALLFVIPSGLQAQEPQERQPMARDAAPAHIYEAYYRVSPGDLPEWNRIFMEHATPILDDLQSSGTIEGWSHWQHHTGGDYNVRFTARTYDWTSINTFWNEYLSRLNTSSESEGSKVAAMIQAHKDEIWDVSHWNVAEGYETNYMYASTYKYNFSNGEEWHRIWNEVSGPVLQQAMDEGKLGGWVILDHNTGGEHNFKVLYLFDEWGDIDDLFDQVGNAMSEQHSADWKKFRDMIESHDDVIWVPVREEGQ